MSLEVDKKIETHREECTKDFVSNTNFKWSIGIAITVLIAIFGYLFYGINAANAKADIASTDNNKTQTQLSQIQTDLTWIKSAIQNK